MDKYERDNPERWKLIRTTLPEGIRSAVDVGGRQGWFASKLADLYDCPVEVIDSHHATWEADPRVLFRHGSVGIHDHSAGVRARSRIIPLPQADLYLYLSVLHHIPNPVEILEQTPAQHVIVESAVPDAGWLKGRTEINSRAAATIDWCARHGRLVGYTPDNRPVYHVDRTTPPPVADTVSDETPRTLSLIWLGPRTPPKSWADAWRRLNPDLEVTVHREPQFPLMFPEAYERAPTWVHRADLYRLEVIYQYGGAYSDFDVEPLRPLPPFPNRPFMARGGQQGQPSHFFGAPPQSDTILRILKAGADSPMTGMPNDDTGPGLWHRAGWDDFTVYEGNCDPLPPKTSTERVDALRPSLLADPTICAVHHYQWSWRNLADVAVEP